MIKQLFFTAILLIISINYIFSQTETNDKYDWKLYKETDGVQIFNKNQECHDYSNGIHKQLILLKFVNTNPEPVQVNFHKDLYYNDKLAEGENSENDVTLYLESSESVEGDCSTGNLDLRIFVSYMQYEPKSILTKFELTDINVEK